MSQFMVTYNEAQREMAWSEYALKPVSACADRLHRRATSEVSKLEHGVDFALPERGFARLFATTDLTLLC